ncbi:MAG: hypothetical protein RI967_1568 [Planctomycetota bacterium]
MNRGNHHDPDGFRPPHAPHGARPVDEVALPPELRRIASLLDDEGAFERASLSEDALERMLAASDLQLPVAEPVGAGRAVLARIGPSPMGWAMRIAAAVALAAAVVLVAIAAWRGGADRADTVPGGLLVDGGGVVPEPRSIEPAPAGGGEAGSPADASRPLAEHFERALVIARPASGSAREAVVAAIAVPTRGGDGTLGGAPAAVAVALLDTEVASNGASYGALDFSGLEGEMASILGPTAGLR